MPDLVDNFTALISGQSWSGEPSAPMVVTYSFETAPADYLTSSGFSQAFADSFQPFTSAQKQQALQGLQEWAAGSGITFVEVPAGQGDMRFGNYNFNLNPGTSGFSGFAYYPNRDINDSWAYEGSLGGDVFIDIGAMFSGSYNLMLHEIGHAIGLEHPHDGDVQLQSQYDNGTYSVMSYNRESRDSGMGIFDYEATQYIYGNPSFMASTTGGITAFNLNESTNVVTQTWGSAASDIFGSSLRDMLDAGAGNDKVAGFGGNDTLGGGAGDDTLFGGLGDDTLLGGAGNDILYGGDYWGDPDAGSNTASYAGAGSGVTITLGQGIWNGSFYVNASGADTGEDRFYDIINAIGSNRNDMMTGNDVANRLFGSGGFDTIYAGLGNDYLNGGDQADKLHGGAGNDFIDGGAGFDNLFGEAGDDTLLGGTTADRLFGGTQNDELYGGSNVGITVDGLFGEEGDDTLYGQAGFDHLEGGIGNDLLDGGHQADNLYGGAGDDTLRGDLGLDRLFGGDGNDFGRGGEGNDGLFGEAGDDTLNGEAGDDRFFGGTGSDDLDGSTGNDSLFGGAGFDTLKGGLGDDILQGDFNADTFVFRDGEGNDTITDFAATNPFERIDLSAVSAITDLADLQANHLTQLGSDVVIDTGGGNSVTLSNVILADLDSTDFVF